MKIKDYKCKCGYNNFFLADKGKQTGIYCSYCGKWLKWADKDERNLKLKEYPRKWGKMKREIRIKGFDKGKSYALLHNLGGIYDPINDIWRLTGEMMTYEELIKHFDKDYSNEKIVKNPLLIVEAIGFIMAVKLMFPEYERSCDNKITLLAAMCALLIGVSKKWK